MTWLDGRIPDFLGEKMGLEVKPGYSGLKLYGRATSGPRVVLLPQVTIQGKKKQTLRT